MRRQSIPVCAPDRRRSSVGTRSPRPVTVSVTCAVDGYSHRVTDQAFGVGHRHGCYRALCGHAVAAAAMVSPDGPPCRPCLQYAFGPDVNRITARSASRVTRHRKPGGLRRLISRRRTSGTDDGLVRRIPA